MKVFPMVATVTIVSIGIASMAVAQPWPQPPEPVQTIQVDAVAAPLLTLEETRQRAASLEAARVDGKYQMLLRQFDAPQSLEKYGEFRDHGLADTPEGVNANEPTRGCWVYVHPTWYVWRDLAAERRGKRGWGPEQAAGAPDTPRAGDIPTAWASRTQDEKSEWLLLEYSQLVTPSAIRIYETYNPGAVEKATAFALNGQEFELWTGADPTREMTDLVIFELRVNGAFPTNRLKIYLNSPAVTGWNEIDAVGMVDGGGKMHWAKAVAASTTYAEQGEGEIGFVVANATEQRLAQLEAEVQRLKAEIQQLQQALGQKAPVKNENR